MATLCRILLFALCTLKATLSCDVDEWAIDTIGKSGKIRWSNDNCSRSLDIDMTSITEYDSSGKKSSHNKVTTFANKGEFSDVESPSTEYQGVSALLYTYKAALELKKASSVPQFTLQTIFFKEEGYIEVDDTEISVTGNTMKFSTNITDWPFSEEGSTLALCINMKFKGDEDDEIIYDDSDDSVSFGGFTLSNEQYVLCEQEQVAVNVNVTTKEEADQIDICYIFDYCASGNLYYDPFIYYEGDEGNSGSSGSGGSGGSGGSVAASKAYGLSTLSAIYTIVITSTLQILLEI